jgi:hypothetical protein
MTTDKLLINEIYQLPENLKEDVLHYITFLKTRYLKQTTSDSTLEHKKRQFGSAKDKYHLSPDFYEDFL